MSCNAQKEEEDGWKQPRFKSPQIDEERCNEICENKVPPRKEGKRGPKPPGYLNEQKIDQRIQNARGNKTDMAFARA